MSDELDTDALVENLPATYATALRLRDEGATAEMIAQRLGIPLESVSTTLEIAQEKLDRLMRSFNRGSERGPSGR